LFSNQAGVEKGHQKIEDLRGKILDLSQELGFPIQALLATAKDTWRKPGSAMWDYFVENCNGNTKPDQYFFCGDAAGRAKNWKFGSPKDISCSDRAFASNIGATFKTPEEFFLGEAEVPFEWDSIDPQSFLDNFPPEIAQFTGTHPLVSSNQEVIILVGLPAAGKSTFVESHLIPHSYIQVNQDTLKTKEKCVKACGDALSQGSSVVIDNTNPTATDRALYITLANQRGVPVRCFVFDTNKELAQHLNVYREKINSKRKAVPDIGYNVFNSKYQEPSVSEGFSEIKRINFNPQFKSEREKKLFLQRT